MDIFDRFKQIRKLKGLSQTEFGERVGVTRGVIANIELKRVPVPKDVFIKAVCDEFHINYLWLTEGKEPRDTNDEDLLIDEFAEDYKLDDLDKKIIVAYAKLSHDERMTFKKFLSEVFKDIQEKDKGL